MTEKQFELSRYELNRKPQELILDDTEIKVQRKALNALLMCPICLDVLRNTMTTKECLHRFCADCITTALRSGNKECPTCRKRLVSRRSLRHDPIFDALIAKLYPAREVYEKQQEALLTEVMAKHEFNAKAGKKKHKDAKKFDTHDERRETPRVGSKRPFRDVENADEISVVLLGKSVERNRYITIKPESSENPETPKIGHLLEYLKSAGLPESLWSVGGSELLAEDDLSSAMSSSHSGVLKIVYEK